MPLNFCSGDGAERSAQPATTPCTSSRLHMIIRDRAFDDKIVTRIHTTQADWENLSSYSQIPVTAKTQTRYRVAYYRVCALCLETCTPHSDFPQSSIHLAIPHTRAPHLTDTLKFPTEVHMRFTESHDFVPTKQSSPILFYNTCQTRYMHMDLKSNNQLDYRITTQKLQTLLTTRVIAPLIDNRLVKVALVNGSTAILGSVP